MALPNSSQLSSLAVFATSRESLLHPVFHKTNEDDPLALRTMTTKFF
jgi:hypothetical protein